ncbi:MAG: helix-turn-helix transcriptional regulator [Bacteroidetes bacterium]|nr:helix-turn-helix transcriptional regulator [Bacteroidota bacterium]MBL7103210.1 helix-turn-helix transcriptional regulator [Bacteroidales bacterium]
MGQIRNDKLLKLIALKIKELRAENEISQEDFYNDTNIHIARIETGKINISVSTLHSICRYFNISLSDFFMDINIVS